MELFTPDFGLIFWMFVAFGVLFLFLWKFAWPAILKGIDNRADFIDKGVEYAQEAKEQLDNARSEAESFINDARREQARVAAQAEAQKVMDNAKLQIQQQQKEAQQQFRNQVSDFAIAIAGKIVKNQMKDDKAQNALVESLLDDIEKNN